MSMPNLGVLDEDGFHAFVQKQIERCDGCFEVFCVDIKRFTRVANAYGLDLAGQIAAMVQAEMWSFLYSFGDFARIKADQFLVCVEAKRAVQAEQRFNELFNSLDRLHCVFGGRSIRVHFICSQIRFFGANNPFDVVDTVLASVRDSKFKAKKQSSNTRVVCDIEQGRELLDRSRVIRSLRQHRLPSALTLVWQPMLCTKNPDAPLHVEALLRLDAGRGQYDSAAFLLDACINGGQTAFLDNWVITQSLAFLAEHADKLEHLGMLSVNISPCSLNDDYFLLDTLALLRSYPTEAKKLCLEITEVGSVLNLHAVQNFLSQCRALGVRIGLDDFGAGFSNFRYAIDLKLDLIKIDGSIVRTICHNKASRAVVMSIARLASDLGCECVAEWVEDLDTLKELKRLDVPCVQGYFVSHALQPEQFFYVKNLAQIVPSQNLNQIFSLEESV